MNNLQKNQKSDAHPMGYDTLLPAGVISQLADEFEEKERLEEQYREDKRIKIKELEQLITSSFNKPIYKLIYKHEYGDFRQFSEIIAKELRSRHACR